MVDGEVVEGLCTLLWGWLVGDKSGLKGLPLGVRGDAFTITGHPYMPLYFNSQVGKALDSLKRMPLGPNFNWLPKLKSLKLKI